VAPAGGGGMHWGVRVKKRQARQQPSHGTPASHPRSRARQKIRGAAPAPPAAEARVSRTSLRVACSAAMLLVSCAAAAAGIQRAADVERYSSPSQCELPAASFPSAPALRGSQLSRSAQAHPARLSPALRLRTGEPAPATDTTVHPGR
jgi:hypothetical protein